MTILGFHHHLFLFLIIQEWIIYFFCMSLTFLPLLIFRKWTGNGEINVLLIGKQPTKKTNWEEWPDTAECQRTHSLYLTDYGVQLR